MEQEANKQEEVKDSTNTDVNTETKEELTLEMVQKMIQSETDKVRTDYSKKLKAKEQEIESIKKNSMSEQERLDYEKQTLQQQLDERERVLKEKEDAFLLSQVELEAVKLLNDYTLPIKFKEFLVTPDLKVTTTNIKNFKAAFDEAIDKVVNERIKGTAKEHIQSVSSDGMTKEDFLKMPYKERIDFQMKNPELTKELLG